MENEQNVPVADIKEALEAMASNHHFANAGIDPAFIKQFARNMNHFDKLPESARKRIREQFLMMAFDQSYRTSVAEISSEMKPRAMADWFKGVNLLLAEAGKGAA